MKGLSRPLHFELDGRNMDIKRKRILVATTVVAALALIGFIGYRALCVDTDTLKVITRYKLSANGKDYLVEQEDARIGADGLLYVTDGKYEKELKGTGYTYEAQVSLEDAKPTTLTAYFSQEDRYVQLGDFSQPSGYKTVKDAEDRDGDSLTSQFDLSKKIGEGQVTLSVYAYMADQEALKAQGFEETVLTYPQDGSAKAAAKAKTSYPGWISHSEDKTRALLASPYENAYICIEFGGTENVDEAQLQLCLFETAAKITPGKHLHPKVAEFKLNFLDDDRYEYLLKGLGTTLLITALSGLMGVILGAIVAVVRSTWELNHENMRPSIGKACLKLVDKLCGVYLTVIRGTPVMVRLLIMYLIIFASASDGTVSAVLAFGVNSGAYVAEIVRGGIMSIDRGQFEAGSSLGFNYTQTMAYIIMPQAFKNILPALANEFIALLKETSVAGYAAVKDLNKGGSIIRSVTHSPFMPLIAVALIYLAVVMFFTKLVSLLERRMRSNDHRS